MILIWRLLPNAAIPANSDASIAILKLAINRRPDCLFDFRGDKLQASDFFFEIRAIIQ